MKKLDFKANEFVLVTGLVVLAVWFLGSGCCSYQPYLNAPTIEEVNKVLMELNPQRYQKSTTVAKEINAMLDVFEVTQAK